MSSPQYAAVPAAFEHRPAVITAGVGTAAKILVDALVAAAATATTPLYYGGGTVIDMTAVNSGSAAIVLQLWNAKVTTTVGGSTGTATTTASTITRAAGSFITDGFRIGDLVMMFAPVTDAANAAVDGIVGIVTAVAALQLTVNGAPYAALTLATGTRICKATPKFVTSIAANAGASSAVNSADLLHGAAGDGYSARTEMKLGATDILAVSTTTAVAALPAYVAVDAAIARY